MDNENRGSMNGYSSSVILVWFRDCPAVFCLLFTIRSLCQSIDRKRRSGLFGFGSFNMIFKTGNCFGKA